MDAIKASSCRGRARNHAGWRDIDLTIPRRSRVPYRSTVSVLSRTALVFTLSLSTPETRAEARLFGNDPTWSGLLEVASELRVRDVPSPL